MSSQQFCPVFGQRRVYAGTGTKLLTRGQHRWGRSLISMIVLLYPPSERSETGGDNVFTCVCVCPPVHTQFHWFEWAE